MTRNGNGQATTGPGRTQQKVARLQQQLPPHATELEQCLLGAVLVKPDCLDEVIPIVQPCDFNKPVNGEIFAEMVRIYDDLKKLDVALLHQRLIDQDILDAVGGQDYLIQLASEMPSALNAVPYALEVRDKSINRQIIEIMGDGIQAAYGDPRNPQELIDKLETKLLELRDTTAPQLNRSFGDVLSDAIESLDPDSPEHRAIKTGFSELDRMTSGFRKGEVTVIAARPSMGKSALAVNIAVNIAKDGAGVLFFSLEMSRIELQLRVLSSESGVSSHNMRCPETLTVDDHMEINAAAGRLYDIPLCIEEPAAMTIAQLRARSRMRANSSDVQVIFIDYLQLLRFGRRTESRRVEVGEISRGIKSLARELDVPVVCLSQLNRALETRESHRPRMADLRESGDIEQDADVIHLLHREDYYHQGERNYTPTNVADLIIAKQRQGPTGAVMLTWHGETMTFKSYSDASMYGGVDSADNQEKRA